ncbi:MAG: metal ABC transporter permease [Vigna little leaf phytoplasma]|nr:metal ABC transporter permease [Vigna little leaf phytoplasma]
MIEFIEKIATSFEIDIFLILILCSLSLASLGIFIVLKKNAMAIDAMSHSVLLGIIIAYFIVKDLNSPFLIIGATLFGVLTIFIIEFLQYDPKITKDAAIGIVFTFFFAIAIILISIYTRDVHLDVDAVFLGNIELGHFSQLYKIIPLLLLNLGFILFCYKELKIFIFDPMLAQMLGFSVFTINYIFMFLVSLTTVIAFDVIGSVLTIVCLIGPAATALLLTKKLLKCWLLSLWLAFFSTSLGYYGGIYCDLPIAGCIAIVILIIFLLVLFFSPKEGVISKIIRHYIQRKKLRLLLLLMHLANHEEQKKENYIKQVQKDLNWRKDLYQKCLNQALKEKYIVLQESQQKIILTNKGKIYLTQKNKKWGIKINP